MNGRDGTREQLLEAAGQVFAEKGYEAATVRDICARAGANLAAVNYHFGDKERLYIEAVKRACRSRLEESPLPSWDASTPAEVKLRDFLRAFIAAVAAPGFQWQRQLMLRELAQPSVACMEFVRDVARPHFEALLGILADVLPPRMPLARRHLICFSIIGQCVHHALARPIIAELVGEEEYRSFTPERLAEHIAEFSLAALGLGRPLARAKEVHP
jgi:TetR/AcrR family transcriptional regulator, regulator of cefoperazone and chloramphenicol sensitivity